MTFEEAQAEAQRTGGTLSWTSAKGYYVIPPGGALAPYEGTTKTPVGVEQPPYHPIFGNLPAVFDYYFDRPAWISRTGQTTSDVSLTSRGINALTPIAKAAGVSEREVTPAMYQQWIQSQQGTEAPATTPTQEPLQGGLDQFVRLQEMNGYLVPVYRDANGKEYLDWEGARAGSEADRTYPQPTGGDSYYDEDGYLWVWDAYSRGYTRAGYDPKRAAQTGGMTPYEQSNLALQRERLSAEQGQQQELINWYREQQRGQLEAQKQQRLATLQANPASWLEYAAYSGQPPVIQPWMLPLSTGDYATASVGQPLPTDYTQLPQLTTPSTQYTARMGPTAQQQYYGYEKARTGSTPEETQWRLWSMAPPGGRTPGLNYVR